MGNKIDSLGIIAGNKDFPLCVAQCARVLGVKYVIAVGFRTITEPRLKERVDEMAWLGLGQLGRMKKFFRDHAVKNLVMAGQIPHRLTLGALKFDLEGIQFFRHAREKNAKTLLGGLIENLEKEGFEFLDSTFFLKDELIQSGVLTGREPSIQEWEDLKYGWKAAKALADVEAGQTVVVKKGVLVALEGMEGTDQTIVRGGVLAGKGAVVVKVARSFQDMRYDVPVVGLETLEALAKSGASVLGLEAKKTLVLDREDFFKKASKMKLAVVGLDVRTLMTRENEDVQR